MNVDSIVEKILSDARSDASRTLADTQKRTDDVRAKSDAQISAEQEAQLKEAQAEAGRMRERMLRMAALNRRKDLLALKRELIDQAFENALARLQGMSEDQARAYLLPLLVSSAVESGEIIVRQADAQLYTPAFLGEVNQALRRAGKGAQLTLSPERREISGGFILKQGGMEIISTYDAILEQARPSLEADVAAMLFA